MFILYVWNLILRGCAWIHTIRGGFSIYAVRERSFSFLLSLSMSLSISIIHSVCIRTFFSLALFLSPLFLYAFIYISLCFSLSLYLILLLFSHYFYKPAYISLSLYLCISLSLFLYCFLSISSTSLKKMGLLPPPPFFISFISFCCFGLLINFYLKLYSQNPSYASALEGCCAHGIW